MKRNAVHIGTGRGTRAFLIALFTCMGTSGASAQSCPTKIPQTVLNQIRNPQIKSVTQAKVIDQSFIDQNGGAEAMMTALRQQISEYDVAIRAAENCIAQSSQNPAAVGRDNQSVSGSCRAALDDHRDARRASEAYLPILSCWARQPSAAGGRGAAGAGTNAPVRAPSARAIENLIGAISATGDRSAANASDTDWNAVQRRLAIREDRIKAQCGEAPAPPRLATSGSGIGTGAELEAFRTQEREYSVCYNKAREQFDRETPGLFGSSAGAGFQPLLGDPAASVSSSPSPAAQADVDAILNAAAATPSLAFEFEMPNTNRPDRDFLKRVWGQLRSTGDKHDLLINVGDINRNWLTTDQCVSLDVTFQLTVERAGGGRSFPTVTVPVRASEGAAEIRAPLVLEGASKPSRIEVTRVAARSCSPNTAAPPPASSCPTSLEDQRQLLLARGALNRRAGLLAIKRGEMSNGLAALNQEISALRAEEDWLARRTRVSHVITGLQILAGGGLAAAENAAVGFAMAAWQSIVEKEDGVVEALQAVTEFSERSLSSMLTVASILKNEMDLADYRNKFDAVVETLQRQVRVQMGVIAQAEKTLSELNMELARLEAVCR